MDYGADSEQLLCVGMEGKLKALVIVDLQYMLTKTKSIQRAGTVMDGL